MTDAPHASTHPVIYFDNAATTWPKPPEVADAIARFLREGAANPGRAAHKLAIETHRAVARLRDALASLIGADDPDRVVLTSGCTESINTAIYALFNASASPDWPFHAHLKGARPRVVTTAMEHNAVRRPLANLEAQGRVDVHVVGEHENGVVNEDALLASVDERTLLVAMTHVSNICGAIQPVESVGKRLREERPRTLFLVDGAQSVGLLPVNVRDAGVDFLTASGHKTLLGPTGIGVLYISPRAFPDERAMTTLKQGGTGDPHATFDMPGALPKRYEPGTPNTVGAVGLLAAIEHAPAGALEHERRLARRILDWAENASRVRSFGPAEIDKRTGITLLAFDDHSSADVAAILDASFNIATRPGTHCAHHAHAALGAGPDGALRASPGPYTTDDEVSALLGALAQITESA